MKSMKKLFSRDGGPPPASVGAAAGQTSSLTQLENFDAFATSVELFTKGLESSFAQAEKLFGGLSSSLSSYFDDTTQHRSSVLFICDVLTIFKKGNADMKIYLRATKEEIGGVQKNTRLMHTKIKKRNAADERVLHYSQKLARLRANVAATQKAQDTIARNESKLQKAVADLEATDVDLKFETNGRRKGREGGKKNEEERNT
eukprot:GHVT01037529.1.p1 GENE.GHVT01037529.1~~GHVT01037529.1.p1  ORF type:complete len:202 (-),score=45.64 GHVT01037529.1:4860-5465(-)